MKLKTYLNFFGGGTYFSIMIYSGVKDFNQSLEKNNLGLFRDFSRGFMKGMVFPHLILYREIKKN